MLVLRRGPVLISYAQNFEDVILARAFKGVENGFYIDVGAWHHTLDSVTKHFYEIGWRGINIEPTPQQFSLLEKYRPRDVNLCVALSNCRGRLPFYEIPNSGLSTFDANSPLLAQNPSICYEVEVTTLADVCRAYANEVIHFLKIDVEGHEQWVLEGGDWENFRPVILVIEATVPQSATPSWEPWNPLLLERGYEFVYFDALNRFYLRQEDIDLKSCFSVGPNCRDNFRMYNQVLLQKNYREAVEELEQLKKEFDAYRRSRNT